MTSIPGGIDLTGIGMDGCSLYAMLDTLVSFGLTGAVTSYGFLVPNSSTLIGVNFAAQAATLPPGATPLSLLSSNGLELLLAY